jgi:DNA anti-recombination protein RmuC
MEPTMEWNDSRLDELTAHVNAGLSELKAEFRRVDARFDKVDERFEQVNARIDKLLHVLMVIAVGFGATVLAAVVSAAAVIAF